MSNSMLRKTAVDMNQNIEKQSGELPFPLRIVLNSTGESFYGRHQKPLHRFETADGEKRYGFRLKSAEFRWLKTMFRRGFIEKMEIHISDIAANNRLLNDSVKLVFFSMFRHRIICSVTEEIYRSPMVRTWNRTHPKQAIGPDTSSSPKLHQLITNSLGEEVHTLKETLTARSIARISSGLMREDEDRKRISHFIADLVTDLNPLVLFVLVGSKDQDRSSLLSNITHEIVKCARIIDILDLASVFTMELVSAAERSALLRSMKSIRKNGLPDTESRQKLMDDAKFRGTTMVISVPNYIPGKTGRLKFQFSVYNDASDAETERKLLEDSYNGVRSYESSQQLDVFFQTDYRQFGDNSLRFFYLSQLKTQCEYHKILFDAVIQQSSIRDSLVTSLSFGF